jgi:PAS domain S-box-containing protein
MIYDDFLSHKNCFCLTQMFIIEYLFPGWTFNSRSDHMKKQLVKDERLDYKTLDNLMEGFQLIGYDWRYLYVNEACARQARSTKDELLGSTMMEKYPGIEYTDMFKTLNKCMEERENRTIYNEFEFPDGTTEYFELRIQPVPEGLFILSVDITDRMSAENEKKEYIKGLEEMLHMTSHQLRQPITNIEGLLSLIQGSESSLQDFDQIVSYIRQSIVDLDVFTADLTVFIQDLKKKTKLYPHITKA